MATLSELTYEQVTKIREIRLIDVIVEQYEKEVPDPVAIVEAEEALDAFRALHPCLFEPVTDFKIPLSTSDPLGIKADTAARKRMDFPFLTDPKIVLSGGRQLRHVEKARIEMQNSGNQLTSYIDIENIKDFQNRPPIVKFTVQSDPVSEVGVNGLQVRDMLEYVLCLIRSFNDSFSCRENSITITKLEEALMWQDKRTADREKRGVEGRNDNG